MRARPADACTLPPGPTGPHALVAARFLLQGPHLLETCQRRYGDFFTIRLSSDRTVVTTADPATVKQVFTGDPERLLAGAGNRVLRPLLGSRSVLVLDGPEHLRQRRLMLPPFHGERMRRYGELMAQVADRHVAAWPAGEPFAVHRSMQAITLEVILRAVLGIEDAARVEQAGSPLRRLLDAMSSPTRLLMLQLTSSAHPRPRSPWGRIRALIRPADDVLLAEIRARRADPDAAERDDILSLLLSARDERGEPLTEAELRDELMTLLVAGHETTATALAWTLERLVRHPEVLARLQESGEGPERDRYLDAVVKETLRLRPVVPAVVRQLTEPMEFGGYLLPAGVHIAPSIYLLHRRADLYPDPGAFRPERFLERPAGTYEWIPFGGGIRRCLGASFALFEMQAVLAAILRRHRLEPTGDASERMMRRTVTFTPARGGRLRVMPREATAPPPAPAIAGVR